MTKLSDPDRRLLREVQKDADRPLADLAQAAGMATSTVWRKLQEYQAAGLMTGAKSKGRFTGCQKSMRLKQNLLIWTKHG